MDTNGANTKELSAIAAKRKRDPDGKFAHDKRANTAVEAGLIGGPLDVTASIKPKEMYDPEDARELVTNAGQEYLAWDDNTRKAVLQRTVASTGTVRDIEVWWRPEQYRCCETQPVIVTDNDPPHIWDTSGLGNYDTIGKQCSGCGQYHKPNAAFGGPDTLQDLDECEYCDKSDSGGLSEHWGDKVCDLCHVEGHAHTNNECGDEDCEYNTN